MVHGLAGEGAFADNFETQGIVQFACAVVGLVDEQSGALAGKGGTFDRSRNELSGDALSAKFWEDCQRVEIELVGGGLSRYVVDVSVNRHANALGCLFEENPSHRHESGSVVAHEQAHDAAFVVDGGECVAVAVLRVVPSGKVGEKRFNLGGRVVLASQFAGQFVADGHDDSFAYKGRMGRGGGDYIHLGVLLLYEYFLCFAVADFDVGSAVDGVVYAYAMYVVVAGCAVGVGGDVVNACGRTF